MTDRPFAQTAGPPAGLYIHIPFCLSICPYCDFVVYAGRAARGPESRIGRLVAALEVELGLRADGLDARWGPTGRRPVLETLYLGGGTPSLLDPEALARLLAGIRRRFGLAPGAEVTLEANPGPAERGDLEAARRAGVNRLSIGAQSFDPAELRALGRRHSPDDIGEAVRAGREAGIAAIGIDLLYDVPGQTLESWSRTLDAALALAPDHVSLYALTLDDPDAEGLTGPLGDHLPLRAGARRWRDAARGEQDEDRAAAMYELADERLAGAGFEWYEISNWARPGRESRHNLGYWRGRPWEALGPGAHAFDGRRRRWNAADLDRYVAALLPTIGRPTLPPGGVAEGSPSAGEDAILSLRTRHGLPARRDGDEAVAQAFSWAATAGLLAEGDGRLVLTRRGRLLADELFARLI